MLSHNLINREENKQHLIDEMQRIVAFLCCGANSDESKSEDMTKQSGTNTTTTITATMPLPNIRIIDDKCDAGGSSHLRQPPDPPGDYLPDQTTSTSNNSNTATRRRPPPRCEICFDDENEIATTSSNNDLIFVHWFDHQMDIHWFCKQCIRQYLIQCENDRKQGPVKCPYDGCSVYLADTVVKEILQRPYQPKVWYENNATITDEKVSTDEVVKEDEKKDINEDEDENDDDAAFYDWISKQDHMQCENCNVYIIREEGCEAMQCLCGWRFCYDCRLPTPVTEEDMDYADGSNFCTCHHNPHDFYDNILKTEGVDAPDVATHDELQDMATFYDNRLQELDDED